MTSFRRRATLAGLSPLLGSLCVASLCLGCPAPLENPVKIGVVLALSGTNSAAGTNQLDGAKLAAEQINEQGGILGGRPVVLVLRDDVSTVAKAREVALDLVENEHVQVILGSNPGQNSLEIAKKVTIPNQVVQVSGASTLPELSTLGPNGYFFRTVPNDIFQMSLLAERAANVHGFTRVAQIYAPVLASTAAEFERQFTMRGGTITSKIQITENQFDYKQVLTDTFASNPQAVQISCRLLDTATMVHNYVDNFTGQGAFWFFSNVHAQNDFITAAGPNFTFQHEGTRPTVYPGNPRFPDFSARFKTRFGVPPSAYGQANTYDALMLIALAIQAAGVEDGPAIRAKMQEISSGGTPFGPEQFREAADAAARGDDINYEGASGTVDFDDNGDVTTGYDVWKIEGGQIINLATDITVQ